ncbi:hypothetical protein DNL40_11485 [Xylanimonas oleitrophica]|uniref:Uncharacterized protein n=2 Tax=Xylanimonas oleitrophica TaxID=2607479 RepID=A0A2W5WPE6_9MICO|nr:hypothetical protein DNL40_11485 [Xylanimonas oleitrophica]
MPARRPLRETPEELRARIPGWGVDLDPADRPSVPRLRFDPDATGAHWDFPARQPEERPRERSIEHAMLTPAFGTAQPLHGLSGAVRRLAYQRFSEGRAAHWLLLMAGDRVDVAESRVTALLRGRPDNLVAETGVRAEVSRHGWSSRVGARRTDVKHQALDPLIVAGPWVLGGAAVFAVVRRIVRARRR